MTYFNENIFCKKLFDPCEKIIFNNSFPKKIFINNFKDNINQYFKEHENNKGCEKKCKISKKLSVNFLEKTNLSISLISFFSFYYLFYKMDINTFDILMHKVNEENFKHNIQRIKFT